MIDFRENELDIESSLDFIALIKKQDYEEEYKKAGCKKPADYTVEISNYESPENYDKFYEFMENWSPVLDKSDAPVIAYYIRKLQDNIKYQRNDYFCNYSLLYADERAFNSYCKKYFKCFGIKFLA